MNLYQKNLLFGTIWFISLVNMYMFAGENIVIEKKSVTYQFVPFDKATDDFAQNIFKGWEGETFEIFDYVKDEKGIAVDLGAWIGTTAIWLSKNFSHVVAVDADRISLTCLKRNLEASGCTNVSICDKPIMESGRTVIFGPRGSQLNESISHIKLESNSSEDYCVKAITFKQLLHDFVFSNDQLSSHRVSFIKCDIEGGEEYILEDMFHFAYYNNCKVYLSFHLDWWKSAKIEEYEYLFKHFDVHCQSGHSRLEVKNVIEYVKQNPFTSLLFEPKADAGLLKKKNIPAVIIGYNQYTYIKDMVSQLEKYTSDIVVIDNNSNFKPLLDYYENDFRYTLLKQKENYGYTVYKSDVIQKLVGDLYVLTDPDLKFNPDLPEDFLHRLIEISDFYESCRVGFALHIDSSDIRPDITYRGATIQEWESQFWKTKLNYPIDESLQLYQAYIDTTFCLINRRYNKPSIRVAGNFTCYHLPWHQSFRKQLIQGEYESYTTINNSTNWFK